MQSGRRSCHGAADMSIQGLIALCVNRFCLTIEIRRNRDCAAQFQHSGERDPAIPEKLHNTGLTVTLDKAGLQSHRGNSLITIRIIQGKNVILPALSIPDHTFPTTTLRRGESGVIFRRIDRLKAEDLDVRTSLTLKMKPGWHNLGVIEYHKRAGRQERGNILEYVLADIAVLIAQKL